MHWPNIEFYSAFYLVSNSVKFALTSGNYVYRSSFDRVYYPVKPIFEAHRNDFETFKREGFELKNKEVPNIRDLKESEI